MIMIMAIFSAIGIVAVLGRIVWMITKVMEERENVWSNISSLNNNYRLLSMQIATLDQRLNKNQKTEFVQMGGQKLHISPDKEMVSWKDFEDFLDDNAEDFDSIGEKLEALEDRLNTIEGKERGTNDERG